MTASTNTHTAATADFHRTDGGEVTIVDSDVVSRRALQVPLEKNGYRTRLFDQASEAVDAYDHRTDVVLLSLSATDIVGYDAVRRLLQNDPAVPIIVLYRPAGRQEAEEAMRAGAFDYIERTCDTAEVAMRVDRAVAHGRLARRCRDLHEIVCHPGTVTTPVFDAPASRRLGEQITRLAKIDGSILIRGSHGTGKKDVASMLHRQSSRANGPFVTVTCGQIPRNSVEAKLFGQHSKTSSHRCSDRAGLAQLAHGGTLFLDNVSELPLELQPRIVSLLQRGLVQSGHNVAEPTDYVDVRVIAATSRDLAALSALGGFCRELYDTFHGLHLHVPDLHERPQDLPELVRRIVDRIGHGRLEKRRPVVTDDALRAIASYAWPGNLRELENVLEVGVARSSAGRVTSRDLEIGRPTRSLPSQGDDQATTPQLQGMSLVEIEELALRQTLSLTGGNRAKAARILGISDKSVYNKVRRYGIDVSAL